MKSRTNTPGAAVHNLGPAVQRASGRRVRIGAFTVLLAILSGLATFLVLTGLTPISPTHNVVVTALLTNGLLLLCLTALILLEIVRLVQAHRKGIAGARLHSRIVGLFALVAALPAIIVAIVASVTLDRGLDRWFAGRTRAIIESSGEIALAYIDEHARDIRTDLDGVAAGLERVRPVFDEDKGRFDELVRIQALLRNLSGTYVIKDNLDIVTRVVEREGDTFLVPPDFAIEKARQGETVILTPGPGDDAAQVAGLVKLKGFDNAYLYVVRRLDPKVVAHLRRSAEATIEYRALEARRFGVQVAFGLMYVGVALILLLSAVWIGFWFANRLVAPIRRLIGAAKLVSQGNLEVQVPVKLSEGELANLGATFNGMTSQLNTQRKELLSANEQLDMRRRFTEAVLAGVTAGVIGLDDDGVINLVNRSAETILGAREGDLVGRTLAEAVPEIAEIFDPVIRRRLRTSKGQINLTRGGRERNITVRVTTEETGQANNGFVVTLDDISDLVTAQRTSAWADVARRIAHEIKNPLTPIQLSAERLKRKYSKVIETDHEIFEQCTDTIIRQVGDIGRMVDEFSSFARMPKAVMAKEDIADAVRQAAFLIGVSQPEVDVSVQVPENGLEAVCDRRLISQVVTNLVKNAIEAISTATMAPGETPWVKVILEGDNERVKLTVTDNGCGLPEEGRRRLLEPYMTTREKGTGLGLAIVRKIIEDHGGTVALADAPQVADGGHGASIQIEFPRFGDGLAGADGAKDRRPRSERPAVEPTN